MSGWARAGAEEPSVTEIVEHALPAVVLILNYRPDGSTMYGSGLIVSKDGRVLTNHHVIENAKSIGAMVYKPGRTSYTPMDGGLGRYIFENHKDILKAELLDEDVTADLAVIKINVDTSKAPSLNFALTPPRPGERVFALGHPQETVWSFTAGAVSALHNGAIQHDAVISNGSSGGPLLNTRGEVIGINTARVVSESRGLSFARPIAMASSLITRDAKAIKIDLSSPEKAVLSCWHAEELALPSMAECFDWDAKWLVFKSALDEIQTRKLSPKVSEIVERFGKEGAKEHWIKSHKQMITERLRTGEHGRSSTLEKALNAARELRSIDDCALLRHVPKTDKSDKTDHKATSTDGPSQVILELASLDADRRKRLLEKNGIKVDLYNAKSLSALLKMGVRVEETFAIDRDHVWVLLAGRNPDGTPFHYSEFWVNTTGRWLQRSPPMPSEMAKLPMAWAPPVDDFQFARQRMIAALVESATAT